MGMLNMRILITGGKGRLGSSLHLLLGATSENVMAVDIDEIDISDFAAIRALTRQFAPQTVINVAAWTDVDGCARDPEHAIRMNGLAAQNVALAAADVGASVVQVSMNE